MKGRGNSAKNRNTHYNNDGYGDVVASQHRRIEHERRKQLRLEETNDHLQNSCHSLQASLDAYDSCGELSGTENSQFSG